jgi:hypothetical protein
MKFNNDRRAAVAIAFAAASLLGLFAQIANASPIGYSVRSDTDRKLFSIDLATGVATELGATGFSKIEALAMNADGELFGVNPQTAQLARCSTTTGACTVVGTLANVPAQQTNAGLTFGGNGVLYLAMNALVYVVNPATAETTALGPSNAALSGLAAGAATSGCSSGIYAVGGNSDQGKFYCINTTSGAATQLATLSSVAALDGGLDGDLTTGFVWGITNETISRTYSIDPKTLSVANVKQVTFGGAAIGGFESLAVARTVAAEPVPTAEGSPIPTLGSTAATLLMIAALAVLGASRRRNA